SLGDGQVCARATERDALHPERRKATILSPSARGANHQLRRTLGALRHGGSPLRMPLHRRRPATLARREALSVERLSARAQAVRGHCRLRPCRSVRTPALPWRGLRTPRPPIHARQPWLVRSTATRSPFGLGRGLASLRGCRVRTAGPQVQRECAAWSSTATTQLFVPPYSPLRLELFELPVDGLTVG